MQKPAKEEVQAILIKVREVRRFAEDLLKDMRGSVNAKNVKNLVDRYEEARNWIIYRYSSEVGSQMPFSYYDDIFYSQPDHRPKEFLEKSDVEIIVRDLIIGCRTAESYLESILRPLAEPEVLDRLNSLRKELDELEEKGLDLDVAKSLREAVDEAEQGHHLASAMISSRVICYLMDKIPGKDDDEKVKHLVERGIVPRDRKDIRKQMITSMRLSRNLLSHRVDLFPSSGEMLVLLGGAFNLDRLTFSLKMQKGLGNLPQQSSD